jgi:hypothetical protein
LVTSKVKRYLVILIMPPRGLSWSVSACLAAFASEYPARIPYRPSNDNVPTNHTNDNQVA